MMAKLKIVLIPLGILCLFGIWQGITYLWRHGYSTGARSGVIRKISVRGSPVCKYLSGELVLQGPIAGIGGEVWEFTVDERQESNPLVKQLQEAERSGARTTLRYRQDLPMWWTCNPLQHKVVAVEK